MLAMLGILGCSVLAVVLSVVGTVVSVGITTGMGIYSAQQDAEAAKQAKLDAEENMINQQNQARADRMIQKKLVERNLIKAQGDIGSSIAYQTLLANRTRRKAAKTAASAKGLTGASFNKAEYPYGNSSA